MTVEWVEFVLYGYLAVTLLTAGAESVCAAAAARHRD